MPPCPNGCRSICASPTPADTASSVPSTTPPTTRLAAASASGPSIAASVVLLPLAVCCCATAPEPLVPLPSMLSYSNTDQAQACCCWPAKSKVSGPALGAGPMARKQVTRLLPGPALVTLATCCQVRLFPEAVGVPGPPTFWPSTKASTRRPAPGVIVAVAKLELAVTFEPAVRL